MLRLVDARSRFAVEIQPARRGLLRVCAHAPETSQAADLTGLRVLLVADLLARTAELRKLQVLTVLAFVGQPPGQLTDFEQAAGALGMHSPQARVSHDDAQAALDGSIDVHLVSGNGEADGALQGLAVPVGVARVEPPGHESLRSHPLAARLVLLSVPYYQPADLADGQLTEAAGTVRRWRRQVAEWAELPSRPMAADTAAAIRSAFDELDTVHALALLRDLSLDASTPAGAKFETFLYADRVLGLGLPSEIGQPGA
jgi:hypothetical protein